MKPSTKIVLAIVVVLSIAYGILAVLSSTDGVPEEAETDVTERVVDELEAE